MTGRTYIFAGGGTGGHLFPGIAVAQELVRREPDARILFVGSEQELERSILAHSGWDHRSLPVESFRSLKRRPWRFLVRNWQAWRLARRWIRIEQPSAVIGLGGYVSVPTVQAAARAGIPVVLLEQNVIPGRATRWLARSAAAVCVAFAESSQHLKSAARIEVTGNPVRREIAVLSGVERPANGSSLRQLLVLGGSQGAESLNEAVVAAAGLLSRELANWRIIHQAGPRQADEVRSQYGALGLNATVQPFFDDMAPLYREACLVISRAGATTIAELTCCGLPSLLLPYPFATDQHQRENANVLQTGGAAIAVEHRPTADATGRELAAHCRSLLADPGPLKRMSDAALRLARPTAAADVADLVQTLAVQRGN